MHTRSTNIYGKTPATKCEAPYSRTHLDPENFATAVGDGLLKTIECAVVKIAADGNVRRIAGAPFACEESGQASQVRGQAGGPAGLARLNKASGIVAGPEGNIWVVDQSGCSLRRINGAADFSAEQRADGGEALRERRCFNGAADFSAEQRNTATATASATIASMGPLISQRNNF